MCVDFYRTEVVTRFCAARILSQRAPKPKCQMQLFAGHTKQSGQAVAHFGDLMRFWIRLHEQRLNIRHLFWQYNRKERDKTRQDKTMLNDQKFSVYFAQKHDDYTVSQNLRAGPSTTF